MRNVFKLILFALVLNLATGIVTTAAVNVAGDQVFNTQDTARVPVYDSNGTAFFVTEFEGTLQPGGVAEDKSNLVFRLLDVISLGYVSKILSVIDHYLFGFINFLDTFVGRWMIPSLHTLLFGNGLIPGLLQSLMFVGYILAGFELWTNKTITD